MGRLMDHVRAALSLLDPLSAGSRAVLLRLAGRFGWGPVVLGSGVAVYAAFRYRTWIAPILLAWCVAAWMHAPEPDRDAGEAVEEEPAGEPADPFPGILWNLIADAPGVHVKTVAEHLHAAAPEAGCDRAAVRAALAARRIPVRGSVRGADGRVNEGVHRADLEVWEKGLSSPGSKPAPGACSGPVATPLTSGVAEGPTGVATPPTAPETPA